MVGKGDPYKQTLHAFKKVEEALKQAGAWLTDVVSTRIYVKNNDHWPAISKAHAQVFKGIRPAFCGVVVDDLYDPEALVHVEVVAIVEP